MANARASALSERRSSPYGGGKIKILAPQNTGISSIAKQNAANETDIMIGKYNNGQIGNTEMKAFLQTQLGNQYVSAADKTQIQTKLLDFDVLIEKDRLEAVFKSAPENSIQKAQAATALADFYKRRASTMVPGTPAHSQALENAGTWEEQVTNIQESTNKLQRKNMQNQMLTQINQLPTSSSAKAQARSEMYKKLYDMAISQGDTADAEVYAANMQQELTNAQQYSEQEQTKQTKAEMQQFIADKQLAVAKLTDKTPEEMKAKADMMLEIADKYGQLGDQYNATKYMTSYTQAQEKYDKKVAGLSASQSANLAWQNEKDYSDNIRLAQERYVSGLFSSPFKSAEEEYKDSLTRSVSEWKGTLENIYNTAISMDAGATISWRGSTRKVGAVIDEIEKEYQKINGLENAVESGTVMLKELPISEQIGKNTPKYELIDIRNLTEDEQQLLAPDESGILHTGEMGKQEIKPEDYNSLMQEDNYRKDLSYNSKTGKYYQDTGLQFNVIDPETGQNYLQKAQIVDGKSLLTSATAIRKEAEGLGYKPGEVIDFDPEKAARVNAQQTTMSAEEVRKSQEKSQKIRAMQPKVPEKNLVQQLVEGGSNLLNKIIPGEKVVSPLQDQGKTVPAVAPKLEELKTTSPPVDINKAIQSGGLTMNKPQTVQPVQPVQSQPQAQIQGLTYSNPVAAKPITYTQAPPVNINQAIQSGGLSTPIPAPKPVQAPSLGTKIVNTLTGAAGQALNKLKSLKWW